MINKISRQTIRNISNKLYPGHEPLTTFEKMKLSVSAGLQVMKDPTRQDLVAALGETAGTLSLRYLRSKMLQENSGRNILMKRPIINSTTMNLDKLKLMKNGTFGREYLRFLESNQVSPDTRTEVHYVDDEELAYVMLRYRQTHDFLHTLCDMPISVEAELALKWFELAQFKLPMNLFSVLFGPLILNSSDRNKLLNSGWIHWAIQCGSNSKFLLNVEYENMLEWNLDELRDYLGIYLPPKNK